MYVVCDHILLILKTKMTSSCFRYFFAHKIIPVCRVVFMAVEIVANGRIDIYLQLYTIL